jgi:hypothetical protein
MNLITPFLPMVRVWVFGTVVWALAKMGAPSTPAGPVTDWLMTGIAGAGTFAYGAWASWRERAKG